MWLRQFSHIMKISYFMLGSLLPSQLACLIWKNPSALPRQFESVLILDLDETLYSSTSAFCKEYFGKIISYVENKLHVDKYTAVKIVKEKYKGNIKEIARAYKADLSDFDHFLNVNVNYDLLEPSMDLQMMLNDITTKLTIMTNSGLLHAIKVLERLGVINFFEIISYVNYADPNFVSKPSLPVYMEIMSELKIVHSSKYYFVDDNENNLQTAKDIQWNRLLLNEKVSSDISTGREVINNIRQIEEVWSHLFKKDTEAMLHKD